MAEREFEAVYEQSYRSVLRTVVLLTPSVEDAHDVVQEAFARALARWAVVGGLDAPHEWVRRVAVNAAIDLGRTSSRRRRLSRLLPLLAAASPAPDAASVDVVRALSQIPPHQRRAVVLFHLLDLDVAAVARETGRPEGTVKADLARGRAALARLLTTDEVVLDA